LGIEGGDDPMRREERGVQGQCEERKDGELAVVYGKCKELNRNAKWENPK
jgi:hypothetical protein